MGDQRNSLISDHALLRYMERVLHINIGAMETLMEQALEQSFDFGDGYKLGPDGEYYVMKRNSCVTVLSNDAGKLSRRGALKAAFRERLPDRGWAA